MTSLHAAFTLICLVSSTLAASAASHAEPPGPAIDEAFADYVVRHHRAYESGSQEYQMRKKVFTDNVKLIDHQNDRAGQTWKAHINKFADRTHAELAKLRGWKSTVRPEHSSAPAQTPNTAHLLSTAVSVTVLPNEHSWSNLTAVKDIQDQGGCGSCWAFASATVLRAHSEIWMNDAKKLSVQQIISCTANPNECGGTGGCQGATAELAMDYVFKHGCQTDAELPYSDQERSAITCPSALVQQGSGDEPSNSMPASSGLGMVGWTKLPENKIHPLKMALVTKGPVAVSISAGYSWNQYQSGILDDCPKNSIIDHAVVLIGYGSTEVFGTNLNFWQLQNSWGVDWGENGYLRMLRREDHQEENEQCGTDNDPQIGSGCKGGPSEVHVCGMCGLLYDTVIPHFEDKRGAALAEVKKRSSFLQQYH